MHDKLRESLKKAGYSLTKPRLTVFGALQGAKPKTMRELTDELSGVIDRASVYRTIDLYEELGIVNRLQQGWKYRLELSDAFAPHHHHMTCTRCQRVISFDEPKGIDGMLAAIAKQQGFMVLGHSFELSGLCRICRKSAAERNSQ